MRSLLRTQTGSVTAELAIAMPAVLLVASLLISGTLVGVRRVQLAYDAGTLARAIARGEPVEDQAKTLGLELQVEYGEEFVCARAKAQTWLMPITEVSCQRKLGL